MISLVLKYSTKGSENSDMAKSWVGFAAWLFYEFFVAQELIIELN